MIKLASASRDAGSSSYGAEAPLNILQEFAFPNTLRDVTLYVRQMSGEIKMVDGLQTYGPAYLSFNTYLNSFFEDYWIKHTSLEYIELTLFGTGRFWCSIFRDTLGAGCTLIGRCYIDLGADDDCVTIPIDLTLASHGHGGRIFVDFEVLVESHIRSLSWRTHQEPVQYVSLGVGICTFNREAFLLRTIEKVLGAPAQASIARMVVVNQGAPLGSASARELLEQAGSRLNIISQGNFGGAGGFARAALAYHDDPDVTHVLFMDDDIDLDPRHLVTTAAFLRYVTKPIVLGGHMLDLYRKHILYEAGNTISPANNLQPNHHNLDLNELSSLTALSRAAPSHFNGWWYAAIPVACFCELGFPLPVFIRGDDLEFGTRLYNAGIETVALAPVSVWHEPFYAKPPGWQLYYDMRNRLIFASIYESQFALDRPSKLLKLLMVHLIRYDYQQAWFMMQAIVDFLKGPSLLDEGLPEIHARVTQGSRTLAPVKLGAALGIQAAPADVPSKPWAIRRRMLASLARTLTGQLRRQSTGILYTDAPLQWVKLGRTYVLADRGNHFFQQYAYSRRFTWSVSVKTLRAVARYVRNRKRTAAEWRDSHSELVSEQGWRARLGMNAHVVQAQPPVRAEAA